MQLTCVQQAGDAAARCVPSKYPHWTAPGLLVWFSGPSVHDACICRSVLMAMKVGIPRRKPPAALARVVRRRGNNGATPEWTYVPTSAPAPERGAHLNA